MELQLGLTLSAGSIQDRGKNNKRSLDGSGVEENHESPFLRRNGEVNDEFVVGWPPVKSWRKQVRHHNRSACAVNYVYVENSGSGRGPNSLYVKVKMEGIGIARKIDLSAHRSYRTLAPKLIALFGKCEENAEYKLMYQNQEGKWLHARDVPWEKGSINNVGVRAPQRNVRVETNSDCETDLDSSSSDDEDQDIPLALINYSLQNFVAWIRREGGMSQPMSLLVPANRPPTNDGVVYDNTEATSYWLQA